MTTIDISAQDSFATIAEAAMLAPLPQAYKENLRQQIVAFSKWIAETSNLEEKYEQLELDLKTMEKPEEGG